MGKFIKYFKTWSIALIKVLLSNLVNISHQSTLPKSSSPLSSMPPLSHNLQRSAGTGWRAALTECR